MQLRSKVVLLGVVPVVIAAGVLAFVVEREGTALADRQIAVVKDVLIAARKEELHDLVALARNALPNLENPDRSDETTSKHTLEQLRSLSFGMDGYFYVYNMDTAVCLMHARNPELEGEPRWDLSDDRGQPIIPKLLAQARAGGGYVQYRWQRPSQKNLWGPKLGYVVPLPGRWMLGTGIYLDDVEQVARDIRASSSAAIRDTMVLIAVIAVLAVLAVATVGVALNVSQQRLADAKLRRLTWQVVTAQEEERARMARYLHDEAVQDLVAVKCTLETALIELKSDPGHAKLAETLERGLVGLTASVDEIRQISHDLRPPLQGDGLPALLEQIGAAFAERTGVTAMVDAAAIRQTLSAEAATALFLVTKQALDNIERHAGAGRVVIRLAACRRKSASGTSLTVSDDGCGFDVAAVEGRPGGGIGLLNMRERIEALGGRLSIRSSPSGTEVDAFLSDAAILEEDDHDDGDDGI